jgi:hypothetical protein
MSYGETMKKTKNSTDIDKELKSRMKLFKEATENEKKMNEFHNNIMGSEVLIRFEIFLPEGPGKFTDGLFLYMNDFGDIVDAEYYIHKLDDVTVTALSGDDLNIVKELFKDSFSLEIE